MAVQDDQIYPDRQMLNRTLPAIAKLEASWADEHGAPRLALSSARLLETFANLIHTSLSQPANNNARLHLKFRADLQIRCLPESFPVYYPPDVLVSRYRTLCHCTHNVGERRCFTTNNRNEHIRQIATTASR